MKMEREFVTNGVTSQGKNNKTKVKTLLNSIRKADGVSQESEKFEKLLSNCAKAVLSGNQFNEDYRKGMAIINEVTQIDIEAKGQSDISSRLGMFGAVHKVGMKAGATIKVWGTKRAGGSRQVAEGATAPIMRATTRLITPERKVQTALVGVNYRDMIDNPVQEFGKVKTEAIVDLNNKLVQYAESKLIEGIIANSTINKLYFSGTVTEAVVDDAIGQIRAFSSKPAITGGYKAVSPISEFTAARQSDKAYDEFNELGYITNYKGSAVTAYINPLDYTTAENNATFNEVNGRLLKENTLYVLPAGQGVNDKAFGHTVLYGGITTQTGKDVTTGEELIRYDQAMGYKTIDEHSEFIAVIEST